MPVLSLTTALAEIERRALEQHAVRCYPREACGAVLTRGRERVTETWTNVCDEARTGFSLSRGDMAALVARLADSWKIAVIFHSHVDAPAYLSGDDRRRARYWPPSVLHAVLSIRHGIPGEWVVESLPAPELSRG